MIATLASFAALATSPAELPNTLDRTPVRATTTRAEEIARRFQTSRPAYAAASQGWYSGRCYKLEEPNRAVGTLLVTETRRQRNGEGPIFDREVTKMIPLVHNPGSQDPAFFDNPGPQLVYEIQNYVNQLFAGTDLTEAFEYQGSLSAIQYSLNTRWDQRYDGQYQYIRTVNTRSGAEYAYCYFFKKVR